MDSSGGHHNEKEVVRLALKQGWQDGEAMAALEEDWQASDPDHWNDILDDAVDFLNSVAPAGYVYGNTDGADWGLYPVEQE